MTKHLKNDRIHSSSTSIQPASASPINPSNNKNTLNEHYRNHLLNFIEIEDLCIGEVFKSDERLAYCESVDIDSARQYCRQIIDEHLYDQNMINTNKVPNLDDVVKAMLSIQNQIDESGQLLLNTHLKNKNKMMQIDDLKSLGGLHSTTDVFLRYAQLARLICDALAYLPPVQASGQDPFLSLVIISQEPDINTSSGLSIALKPVIFQALKHINTL
tara:strand:+ start:14199 stop:14846 length:648 start_codon:yes stop_codon:yes gene_type:complete